MLDAAARRPDATAVPPDAEARRAAWPDVVIGGERLNRTTATVAINAPVETPDAEAARRAMNARLFTTTLAKDSPVVEMGWPVHGPFVKAPFGIYFDGYLGVAQKVLDEQHPRFLAMLETLRSAGVLLRREIATDDFLTARLGSGVKTPTDLASLWNDVLQARWPLPEGWRAFFSSSGTEAIEAALKLCYETAYKRFLAKHGMETFRKVQEALGNRIVPFYDRDPSLKDHPVFEDYPFQMVACETSFHGRTLGSLSMTRSKRAHQLGYPKSHGVHHVPFNAKDDPVRARIDFREIGQILAIPGELARVVREQRRIPKDLFAGFLAEPFQGEGGYVPGDPAFFQAVRKVCDETGGLLVCDEVQSIARTGRLFMTEHLGVRPDVLATAKSMVIGITLAGAHLEKHLHGGWHSNTWGSGRILDTNFAWTVLDTLLHHKDPAFGGATYLENETQKGERLATALDGIVKRHPGIVVGHRGLGGMRGIVVRKREALVHAAWLRGLKLLGCGYSGETAVIRVLFLADTLAREIDEFVRVFELAVTDVEHQKA